MPRTTERKSKLDELSKDVKKYTKLWSRLSLVSGLDINNPAMIMLMIKKQRHKRLLKKRYISRPKSYRKSCSAYLMRKDLQEGEGSWLTDSEFLLKYRSAQENSWIDLMEYKAATYVYIMLFWQLRRWWIQR